MFKLPTVQQCFIATILLGIFFISAGLFFLILPLSLTDAVLTQEELRDDALLKSAVERIQTAFGTQWLIWMIGGGAQVISGAVGLVVDGRRNSDS